MTNFPYKMSHLKKTHPTCFFSFCYFLLCFFIFFYFFLFFLFFFIFFYFFLFFLNPKLKKKIGQHSPWPLRAFGVVLLVMYPGKNHKAKVHVILNFWFCCSLCTATGPPKAPDLPGQYS